MDKVRLAVSSLMAAALFGVVVGAHGCSLNPFADISFEEAQRELAGPSSSSSGAGGNGGMGGVAGTGGTAGTGGSGGMGGTGGMVEPCMCADDSNECTTDVTGACPDADPAKCHTVMLGAGCTIPNGGAGHCNPDGTCLDCMACSDALCVERCNGYACTVPTNCKSGNCENGTCCNVTCAGSCRTCNWPELPGTCTRYPNGLQVPGCNNPAPNAEMCDNNGGCASSDRAPLGALCSPNSGCQSGLCRGETCRSPVGEPCVDHLECGTNLCDPTTKTCKSCTGAGAGTCTAGSSCDMATGNCKVFLGQPAGSDAECASGTVIQFLCSLPVGAACTAHHDCIFRNCVNGVCMNGCSTASQCADGGPCSANGVCGMVAGKYCIVNEHCKSGKCTGFPRRCQ